MWTTLFFATGVFSSSARLDRIERILEDIEENIVDSNRVARQVELTGYSEAVGKCGGGYFPTQCEATHGIQSTSGSVGNFANEANTCKNGCNDRSWCTGFTFADGTDGMAYCYWHGCSSYDSPDTS